MKCVDYHLVRHMQQGLSLLELLVTLVVVSIGLLGVGALQTSAIKDNHDSYMYSVAAFLAYDIAERMRVNPQGVRNGDYALTSMTQTLATAPNCATMDCTVGQLADYDLAQWLESRLRTAMPEGSATITSLDWNPTAVDGFGNTYGTPVSIALTLRWRSRVGGNCDEQGNESPDGQFTCTTLNVDI